MFAGSRLSRQIWRWSYGSAISPIAKNYSSGLPELTKDRYRDVRRGPYAALQPQHVQAFRSMLKGEEGRVLTDPSDCEPYNVDWIKNVRGDSKCVLKPRNTEEVSAILKYCNEHRLAVCPQGGNTGLVAGSNPVFDEVVLSTALMNKIINIDETSGVAIAEAGVILETLETALSDKGLIPPLDLGAKGSCNIGGNVSTNAGGLRLLRYGSLHGSVLGVEAVKADGEIIDCMSTLKKDNTGYHLKHLFIGSEGTLGVVTKVAIHCPTKPLAVHLAFLGLDSFDQVLATFRRAKRELGEVLSSCEMIDALSLEVVTKHLGVRCPLSPYPFYMLIETSGSRMDHDQDKLETFLGKVMEEEIVRDGTVTSEPTKMRNIWELRERITEGLIYDGYVFKYDLSLPHENFYSIVPVLAERVGKDATRVSGYGHIGDGNIHLNVTIPEYDKKIAAKIEPFVYEYTSKLNGSVSAEHGIGFRKPKYLHYSKSEGAISLMQQMKKMMDPNGILNPYKVLPYAAK